MIEPLKQRIPATLFQYMVYGYLEGGKPYSRLVAVVAMTEETAREVLEEQFPHMTYDVAVEMDADGEYVWNDDRQKYIYENDNMLVVGQDDEEEEEEDGEW